MTNTEWQHIPANLGQEHAFQCVELRSFLFGEIFQIGGLYHLQALRHITNVQTIHLKLRSSYNKCSSEESSLLIC